MLFTFWLIDFIDVFGQLDVLMGLGIEPGDFGGMPMPPENFRAMPPEDFRALPPYLRYINVRIIYQHT